MSAADTLALSSDGTQYLAPVTHPVDVPVTGGSVDAYCIAPAAAASVARSIDSRAALLTLIKDEVISIAHPCVVRFSNPHHRGRLV
jgi:hypothetical protein